MKVDVMTSPMVEEQIDFPMFLPHELLASTYEFGTATFNNLMFDSEEDGNEHILPQHWNHVEHTSWGKEHPVFDHDQRPLLPFSIPVRHHGDDVSFKTLGGRKLIVVSLHAELGTQASLTSRLLSFIIWDDIVIPNKSLQQILAAWSWSWRCAFEGIWPSCDHMGDEFAEGSIQGGHMRYLKAGCPLAGAYRFAYTGGLGDWVFHHKLYFPFFNGHSHNFCCTRDLASRASWELRFENFDEDALWRSTEISNSAFKDAVQEQGGHPMLSIPGWHLHLQRVDFMHCGFLGLFQISCANVIVELMELGHYGPVHQAKEFLIKSAYVSLQVWLRQQKRTISHRGWTLASLGSPQKGPGGTQMTSLNHSFVICFMAGLCFFRHSYILFQLLCGANVLSWGLPFRNH